MSNFRGIKNAQLIEVGEGSGTPNDPHEVVSYVVVDGVVIGTVNHEALELTGGKE